MDNKTFEENLAQELTRLEKEISPTRELWPGIDHAINSDTITFSKRFVVATSIAACLVLAISLSISASLFLSRPTESVSENSIESSPDIEGFVSLLQNEHARNKQALLIEYQKQTVLAPDWEDQMQQLELAEQAIYEALREDAENIELLKILRQVQSKQIELIESVYAPLFTTI